MTKCPYCREQIPDDSWFCDQCGKELKWCPECHAPKKNTECAVCGETLLDAEKYFNGGKPDASSAVKLDNIMNGLFNEGWTEKHLNQVTCLEGNGWKLSLKEGEFGRSGGIWPELASQQYVSGRHGQIRKNGTEWELSDSGSTNGTFVNGARLAPGTWTILKRGDKVKIATVRFDVK